MIEKIYSKVMLSAIEKDSEFIKSQQYPNHDKLAQSCNINYGETKNKVFDVYYPYEKSKPLPAIFYFHGGGYIGGDRTLNSEFCKIMADQGYIVFNVDYEPSLVKGFPAPIYNAFEFFDFIKNSKFSQLVDYNNVFLSGDSSGGHIAMLIANIQTNVSLKESFKVAGGPDIKGLMLVNPMLGVYKFGGLWLKSKFDEIVYKENKDSEITKVCHNLELDCTNLPPCLIVSSSNDVLKLHANLFEKKAKKEHLYLEHYTITTGKHLKHVGIMCHPYDLEHLYCIYKIQKFMENAMANNLKDKVISKKVSFTNIKKNTSYEELTLK